MVAEKRMITDSFNKVDGIKHAIGDTALQTSDLAFLTGIRELLKLLFSMESI
jgi:hypothetical protein